MTSAIRVNRYHAAPRYAADPRYQKDPAGAVYGVVYPDCCERIEVGGEVVEDVIGRPKGEEADAGSFAGMLRC